MTASATTSPIIEMFKERTGYMPDLENPTTLNEHLLIKKLIDRRPTLPQMTDKLEARKLVTSLSPDVKTIPIIHSEVFAENEPPHFKTLSGEKFPVMVKPNNKSGRSKVVFNNRDLRRIYIRCWRARNEKYGLNKGEWAYSQIPAGIIIEPLLTDYNEYKFWCFNGRCELVQSIVPRREFPAGRDIAESHGVSTFYRNGDFIPVRNKRWQLGQKALPAYVERLTKIADVLANGEEFVRVDLMYHPETDTCYFGEYTFYPGAGHLKWDPPEYDKIFGELFK